MIRKRINYLLVIITLFFGFMINVDAKENNTVDFSRKGSIEVTLHEMSEDIYVEGAEITLYHIADAYLDGVNLAFKYTDEFSSCSVSLDDLTDTELVKEISKCNIDNAVKYNVSTDEEGIAKFEDLNLGLYLVKQTKGVEGYSDFDSFLVAIPRVEDDKWVYDIKAQPKTDIYKVVDIVIEKKWNSHSGNIPNEVEVELYDDEELIETVVLNENNNWTYTFIDLKLSDKYNVKEINIPKGYTPSYKVNDFVFTITNTDTLADTGQIFFPIIVSFILGVILIIIGIRIIRTEG